LHPARRIKIKLDALTPQAGDFMSVFQRVKFPLTWLVWFQVSLTFESRFKIKYQIRPTKPPKSAKTRFINALLKYPDSVITPSLTLRLPPDEK
jgi:hypothetical protein